MLELLIIISLAVLIIAFFTSIVLPVLALGLILIIPTFPLWFPVFVLEGPYEAGDWVGFTLRAVPIAILYWFALKAFFAWLRQDLRVRRDRRERMRRMGAERAARWEQLKLELGLKGMPRQRDQWNLKRSPRKST